MSAPAGMLAELILSIETSSVADREAAALALAFVRDGVLTGEGPTVTGRVHFSRSLDRDAAESCARILPRPLSTVSRAKRGPMTGFASLEASS